VKTSLQHDGEKKKGVTRMRDCVQCHILDKKERVFFARLFAFVSGV